LVGHRTSLTRTGAARHGQPSQRSVVVLAPARPLGYSWQVALFGLGVPAGHAAYRRGAPDLPDRGFDPASEHQERPVAATCDVCGKGPGFGHNISHSHRRTKRRWNPNIQRVKAIVNGVTPKRLNVCTSCLKAGKVAR